MAAIHARPIRAAIYVLDDNLRARTLCAALHRGMIAGGGEVATMKPPRSYDRPEADIAIFYGLKGGLREIMRDYHQAGRHTLYVDLGYWGRANAAGRFHGMHKIVVDGLHPTAEMLAKVKRGRARYWRTGGPDLMPPQRNGMAFLLAGMSAKAAWVYDMEPHEWERRTVQRVRTLAPATEIMYRPKPSWRTATPLPFTTWNDPHKQALHEAFKHTCAVVTHHSNVAIDALAAGLPCYTEGGAAASLSLQFGDLKDPPPIDEEARDDLMFRLAQCQWDLRDMTNGLFLHHYVESGLL